MSAPTPCSACGAFTTGIDCETCGAPGSRQCPACARPFGAFDRHCTGCGHTLKYANFTNRTILRFPRRLTLAQFQYPPDRDAMRMLSKAGPLKTVSRFLQENWSEPLIAGTLEGSAIQVTKKQFPRIRRIADTCQRILDMKPTDVFIRHDGGLGASAFGSEKSRGVVLTSGLIENLNEAELRFVIGRELGHIKADHLFYLGMIKLVTDSKILQNIPFLGEGLRAFVMLFLLPWQRKSQVTADRAGLLCCQNRVTAIKSLIKMALGAKSLYDKVDIEEYLNQAQELATRRFSVKNMGEYLSGSPYVTNRVKELEEFWFSQTCYDIMTTSLHPYTPSFDCPACKAMVYPDNLEEGLMRLSCKACGAAVHVGALPCPHCGSDVEAGDVGMRERVCGGCERPFLATALLELMAPPADLYSLLGVHPEAGISEIRDAFVRVARHQRTLFARLPAYRAYRTLSDPSRRKSEDERRPYLSSLGRRLKRVPRCSECSLPVAHDFCGWCGKKREPEKPRLLSPAADSQLPSAASEPTIGPQPERPAGPIN
ncbi:MAG: M48 family metallopeptidase [Candidatus Wallbacteria bacterium]|nr:M48 family metallopeptidase [Candidatus Wallbacteria bacterium]